MDTSETYIKMCEGAEEIQKEWKVSVGDWFLERHDVTSKDDPAHGIYFDEHLRVIGSDDDQNLGTIQRIKNDTDIWLLRQDQLQEIAQSLLDWGWVTFDRECIKLLLKLHKKLCKEKGARMKPLWSKEEIMLRVVMKEKFNKVWNGEGWKEGKNG